jgi:superfamily II DNA or RNA helicase
MSSGAAFHLPPAFPERAAWGTASKLRAWQQEALDAYLAREPRDFLAVATPGAGKTTYALRVATELLSRGTIERVTVVAPTEHLKTQWADAAARVGIHLDPKFSNSIGRHSEDYHGVAVTYAQVATRPSLHRELTTARPTLVILDEIHHGGDSKSWGDGIREAYEPATRRLALTGTPFRSDSSPIPFVTYEMNTELDSAGVLISSSDYTYGYAEALRDGVVRPVLFMAYGGTMRWRTKMGDEISARLGEPLTKDQIAQAWRTALDPKGEWIASVLAAADKRLTEVRRGVPDAGGLVIASNQTQARSYAAQLRALTGEAPSVVLSDDTGASQRIEEFAAGESRWMVAVRLVSEGVEVPRLAVGVYATSTSTPLFFAQAVGRFVRARRRGETASVFLPSVPVILDHAARLEEQRDHALDRKPDPEDVAAMWAEEQSLIDEANRETKAVGLEEGAFEALESDAHFDHVLFDKQQWGMHAQIGSADEEEYLGLPGLLEPDQVTTLLQERQRQQVKRSPKSTGPTPVAAHRALAAQRKELNKLVSAFARQKGYPHANVHLDLRRACGGPDLAAASSEQVAARIEKIRLWLVGRR